MEWVIGNNKWGTTKKLVEVVISFLPPLLPSCSSPSLSLSFSSSSILSLPFCLSHFCMPTVTLFASPTSSLFVPASKALLTLLATHPPPPATITPTLLGAQWQLPPPQQQHCLLCCLPATSPPPTHTSGSTDSPGLPPAVSATPCALEGI